MLPTVMGAVRHRVRSFFTAVYTLPNGEKEDVAVKVLKESVSTEAQADFEREVQIMSSFKHDNIIKLLGVVFQGIVYFCPFLTWPLFERHSRGPEGTLTPRPAWCISWRCAHRSASNMHVHSPVIFCV